VIAAAAPAGTPRHAGFPPNSVSGLPGPGISIPGAGCATGSNTRAAGLAGIRRPLRRAMDMARHLRHAFVGSEVGVVSHENAGHCVQLRWSDELTGSSARTRSAMGWMPTDNNASMMKRCLEAEVGLAMPD